MSQMFSLSPSHPMPLYAQLTRAIRFAIATGRLRVGEQLPTVRQLAVELRVNANTVAKVYAELERSGILETRRGVGTFVSARHLATSQIEPSDSWQWSYASMPTRWPRFTPSWNAPESSKPEEAWERLSAPAISPRVRSNRPTVGSGATRQCQHGGQGLRRVGTLRNPRNQKRRGNVCQRPPSRHESDRTVRQLAVELRVNANTVAKVYAELERSGILETRRGVGTFVSARHLATSQRDEHEKHLTELIDRFLEEAGALGFSLDDLLDQLQSRRTKETMNV